MKNYLRRKLKTERENFRGEKREVADENILQNFLAAYGNYKSFFIYKSFGSEAGTSLVIATLTTAGKQVYLPRVEGADIVAVPYGDTIKGAFGIDEPTGRAFDGDIDVTVVPLLAVNGRGYRIGYGKGFYDRYLKGRNTRKVGFGYSFQRADFKEDAWDEPLDEFITEKGIYYFGEH